MMNRSYRILCSLPAPTAFERVKRLLSIEGVRYTFADLSLRSTYTPILLLNVQPVGYTRKNWVGINPFTSVSSVEVRCEPKDDTTTIVAVDIDRRRAFMQVAFWIACFFLAASALPEPAAALLVFAGSIVAWSIEMEFVGGYLIKKEISDYLEAPGSGK